MPKFIKKQLDKAKTWKRVAFAKSKLIAEAKTEKGLMVMYASWLNGINAYIKQDVKFWQKWAIRIWFRPWIPNSWVCDDGNYKGIKVKRRLKIIQNNFDKEGKLLDEDVNWLKNEFVPAIHQDMEKHNVNIKKVLKIDEVAIERAVNRKIKLFKQEKKYNKVVK